MNHGGQGKRSRHQVNPEIPGSLFNPKSSANQKGHRERVGGWGWGVEFGCSGQFFFFPFLKFSVLIGFDIGFMILSKLV